MSNGMNMNELQQMQQIEEMKKKIMASILSKEAFERLGRVRASNPQLAAQAELYLLQAYQAGQIKGTVDDNALKELLRAISSGATKDFNITRR